MLKWKPVVQFLNKLKFSAMSFGNHEFDDGANGLAPFLDRTNSPILCANIDVSREDKLKNKFRKSTVKEFDGYKIGIIGYITTDTRFLSAPGDSIRFLNLIESVRAEAQLLKDNGTSIIIAVGHAGFPTDKEIARKIPEVDIVVGGHTDTFLYHGTPPAGPIPVDTYPVVIHRANTPSPALVVQSYAFGKYLGYLHVKFDCNGNIKSWSGNPILLGPSVERDEEVIASLETFHKQLDTATYTILGRSKIFLNGSREICRRRECTMGDFFTDVIVDYFQKLNRNGSTSIHLAFMNGGTIRNSLEPGNVTFSDIYSVFPYGENIEMIPINGSDLYNVFEHSVFNYDLSGINLHGRFLQVSGFKVIYDVHAPPGHRVAELLAKYDDKSYEHVQTDKVYKIITGDYLLSGGDDYQILKNARRDPLTAFKDSEIMKKYLEDNSPVESVKGNRIRFLHEIIEN